MAGEFDRLFGQLLPAMTRNEDGTIALDRSHPAVQRFVAAVQLCIDAGDSTEEILAAVDRGCMEGMRRLRESLPLDKEGQDGR